jgi:hypothetical protein
MHNISQSITQNSLINQLKPIYFWGGISTLIVILLTILDIIAGSVLTSDLSSLTQSATEKFNLINENRLLGLYHFDFLNMIVSLIMIPSFLALYIVHSKELNMPALFSLLFFLTGTTIFITNNSALTMLDLSNKYISATTNEERIIFAAAGEAMIAKGAHGGFGVFPGFFLITMSELVISIVMLKGKVFSKTTSVCGVAGTSLLIFYLVLVTFYPPARSIAMIIAVPGGLLSLAWMILYTKKFFQLARQ